MLKAPRIITHKKYLVDVEEEYPKFYSIRPIIGQPFGMVLLQIAPSTPYDLKRLRQALLAFPDTSIVAVEFRDPEWISTETETLLEIWESLLQCRFSYSEIDDILTSKRAYIRLHGQQWYSDFYDDSEFTQIVNIARDLAHRGASEVYVFLNNDILQMPVRKQRV